MKRRVQLAQVNYRYGNNVFLPYSVGMIQAYALSQPDLAEHYEFAQPMFLRTPIADVVEHLPPTDVLGLSCYIWNWEYCKALAQAVREKYPSCLIVMGGTQVPRFDPEFFKTHPYVACAVPHEGEIVFAEILRERLKESPNLANVGGLMLNLGGHIHLTPAAARVNDLTSLPSPYLTGLFDGLLANGLDFQASQETHRGCPYSCTFCDWGAATMSKVRRFDHDRLIAEFGWMGRHGIELLYNCDANYGLFQDDVALTEKLVETKRTYGAPSKFRAAYAKNSNERVYGISKALNDEGMCKGVTLSFQSMDPGTLEIIKRKNMKSNDFESLITSYRKAKIPTYTELILGLPGETYDSFANGINTLLEAGQHDSLNIYHAMLLPNSEMNVPEYREKHGIRGVRTPLLLLHGSKEPGDIDEFYDVVIETSTMSVQDWIKASLFGYVVQAFHCMNLTQVIAVGLRHHCGISYRQFYEGLIDYALATQFSEPLYRYLSRILGMLHAVADGRGSFDLADRQFGDLMWPVEELLFLWAASDGDRGRSLRPYYASLAEQRSTNDLYWYQYAATIWPDQCTPTTVWLTSNWPAAVEAWLVNDEAELVHGAVRCVTQPCSLSVQEFAKQVVWYGRKGGTMYRRPEVTDDLIGGQICKLDGLASVS